MKLKYVYPLQSIVLAILSVCINSDNPMCKGSDHVVGHWRVDASIHKKEFQCCEFNSYNIKYDPKVVPATYNYSYCGSPTPTEIDSFQGSSSQPPKTPNYSCHCDAAGLSRSTVTRREQFEWKPLYCTMPTWDALSFCTALGARKLLIIGDSTVAQAAVTLMGMLYEGKAPCIDRVVFEKSYYLTWGKTGSVTIQNALRKHLPDLCVLSVGAHLEDEGDMLNAFAALKKVFDDMRAVKEVAYIWKSQSPSHHHCLDSIATSSPQFYEPAPHQEDQYHWNMFPVYDRMARAFTRENNLFYLDMSPLYWRSDGHVGVDDVGSLDCLHYCLPGPLNLFPRLLLQMLLNNESKPY